MGLLKMRFLVIAALSAAGTAGAGDIYCNDQGRDCSDRPGPGVTVVHTIAAPSVEGPASPGPETNAAAANKASAPVDAGANERLSQDAARQTVQKDVAANRAEQCKQAKDKYQKSVEARRVYRVNKDGEREYLSDAEADQARLNARLEMDRACGNAAP